MSVKPRSFFLVVIGPQLGSSWPALCRPSTSRRRTVDGEWHAGGVPGVAAPVAFPTWMAGTEAGHDAFKMSRLSDTDVIDLQDGVEDAEHQGADQHAEEDRARRGQE